MKPIGKVGAGSLVSLVGRSRILGMELVRNKVVPSWGKKEKEQNYESVDCSQWENFAMGGGRTQTAAHSFFIILPVTSGEKHEKMRRV